MPEPETGSPASGMFEGKKKWIWIGVGVVVVLVLFLVLKGKSAAGSSSTATGAAAPSGALGSSTVGQDLASLNNNSTAEWEQVLQAIQGLNIGTGAVSPGTASTPGTPVTIPGAGSTILLPGGGTATVPVGGIDPNSPILHNSSPPLSYHPEAGGNLPGSEQAAAAASDVAAGLTPGGK